MAFWLAARRKLGLGSPQQGCGDGSARLATPRALRSGAMTAFFLDKRTSRRIIRTSVVDNAQLTHKGTGESRLAIYEPAGRGNANEADNQQVTPKRTPGGPILDKRPAVAESQFGQRMDNMRTRRIGLIAVALPIVVAFGHWARVKKPSNGRANYDLGVALARKAKSTRPSGSFRKLPAKDTANRRKRSAYCRMPSG